MQVTNNRRAGLTDGIYPATCPTRTVLDHVTSKWGVLVILALSEESLRWSQLRHVIGGISEKMLAQTLRTLEADGLVHRDAQPSIPPRVDYSLTDRGRGLASHLGSLMEWIEDNALAILEPQSAARASGTIQRRA